MTQPARDPAYLERVRALTCVIKAGVGEHPPGGACWGRVALATLAFGVVGSTLDEKED